jgi:transcriptional regulator with XRE-family HTH domain
MKTNQQLRRMIKRYLKHPRSVTQNELARRSHMGNSTLSQFLDNKHNGIKTEQIARILDTIAPWERDACCVSGKLKTQLLKQYFSHDEIAKIALQMEPTIQKQAN